MSKKLSSLSRKGMVATAKGRNINNKVLSCSTPEHDSPSRDSDSIYDADTTSPIPFLCTQDGAEGERDVVWNYYTPKADTNTTSSIKNSTPLSRKPKKIIKHIPVEKPQQPKRRNLRSTQKTTEFFQELLELNQNLHKFIEKKPTSSDSSATSQDVDSDIFNSSTSSSPKSGLKTNTRCLRKNLLSSRFNKPECETALESDDSMNECLIKASQIVEEKILQAPTHNTQSLEDSVDDLLSSLKFESPIINRTRNINNSACMNNDSFDSIVGNLNDSALDRLTQLPVKEKTPVQRKNQTSTSGWMLQDIRDGSPSTKSVFGRHSSMPESPTIVAPSKPSTSGTMFGRYNSMPYNNKDEQSVLGDSPIRCTPEEIRKKHKQAREKLLAKRLLPFTASQQMPSVKSTKPIIEMTEPECSAPKRACFQPRVASTNAQKTLSNGNPDTLILDAQNINNNTYNGSVNKSSTTNLKEIIEKKRQEALLRLRKKQLQ